MTDRVRAVLLLVLTIAIADVRATEAQVLGYGIAGPAGFSGFFGSRDAGGHAAGGAEVLVAGWAGVGGEFGVLGNSGSVLFVSSVNGVLHFLPSSVKRRLSPYVTGGYTHMSSGDGSFTAWNAGAGLDVWAKDRVGLRVEFRDHVRPDDRGTVQYWTIRAGIVLR